VLAVGLRDPGRAAPHAVHADGRGDRPPDLPGVGFIAALQGDANSAPARAALMLRSKGADDIAGLLEKRVP
jgi:hypothetical protein